MKSYEIWIAIAVSIIVVLSIFLLFALPPMDRHYQDCLEQISLQTDMEQEARVLKRYPELRIAKTNCKEVKLLRTDIERMRGGPVPNVSKEYAKMIRQKEDEIKKLQQQNNRILSLIERTITDLP